MKEKWTEASFRKQSYVWMASIIILLVITIIVIVLIKSLFFNGSSKMRPAGPLEEIGISANTKSNSKYQKEPTSNLLFLLGSSKHIEVLSANGSCPLPEAYPEPKARKGHVVAVNEENHVLMCGGFEPRPQLDDQPYMYYKPDEAMSAMERQQQSKECFLLITHRNKWEEQPSLKVGVSYASAVHVAPARFLVIGGLRFRDQQKVDDIQVGTIYLSVSV